MRYQKKPIEVEASRWSPNEPHHAVTPYPEIPADHDRLCAECGSWFTVHGLVRTLEGPGQVVCPGDYVITGVRGEHYACKPDVFAHTYEPVEAAKGSAPHVPDSEQ